MSLRQRRMADDYDDWGNPTSKPQYGWQQQPNQGLLGNIKAYMVFASRRYRTIISTILFALCLLFYFGRHDGHSEKVAPIDWSKYAYVQ